MQPRHYIPVLLAFFLLLSACGGASTTGTVPTPTALLPTPTVLPTATPLPETFKDPCPEQLYDNVECYTPLSLRIAYGMQSLVQQGFTGKGQTVVDLVAFGSPWLQEDMDMFSKKFHLPPIKVKVIAPFGTGNADEMSFDRLGWAAETELDVEMIHAMAPGANIIVLSSPIGGNQDVAFFSEMLKLEHYTLDHHLGKIISQSWGTSEVRLQTPEGKKLVKQYNEFYRYMTLKEGITILTSSGDTGAAAYTGGPRPKLVPTPTVDFPAGSPYVTAVGGTTLGRTDNRYQEDAWIGSGGGASRFFQEPDYQKGLSAEIQKHLNGKRGVPDVAAEADQYYGLAFIFFHHWFQTGGTSASAPLWAGLVAIANQKAGHPLGFINPALYRIGASPRYTTDLRDILVGDNSFDQNHVYVTGFQAGPGWDALTGWGSPLAENLIPDLIKETAP